MFGGKVTLCDAAVGRTHRLYIQDNAYFCRVPPEKGGAPNESVILAHRCGGWSPVWERVYLTVMEPLPLITMLLTSHVPEASLSEV